MRDPHVTSGCRFSRRAAAGAAVFSAGAILLVVLACGGSPVEAGGVRIVLVTLDTLRADALDAMPKLRARSAAGRSFHRAFSASPATQPTHASLFTGRHPWEHGVSRNGLVLGEAHATLAERLKEAGFATAAVVASFPLHPRFGFAQGFDVFEHRFERDLGGTSWKGAPVAERFYRMAEVVTDEALRLIDEATAPRQFFWFHFFDPHEPYGDSVGDGMPLGVLGATRQQAPERLPARIESARRLYAQDVAYLDGQLDRLLSRLDEEGDRFETHLVVTADHGESFGEGGAFGHGARVTREQVWVPLVFVSSRLAPGSDDAAVGTVDVGRTLLALADVRPDGFGGRDLTQPVEPGTEPAAEALGMRVTGLGPIDLALAGFSPDASKGPRFFLADGAKLYSGDAEEIFEEDDPARTVETTVTAHLRLRFGGFSEQLARSAAVERIDEETRAGLRALGYVE